MKRFALEDAFEAAAAWPWARIRPKGKKFVVEGAHRPPKGEEGLRWMPRKAFGMWRKEIDRHGMSVADVRLAMSRQERRLEDALKIVVAELRPQGPGMAQLVLDPTTRGYVKELAEPACGRVGGVVFARDDLTGHLFPSPHAALAPFDDLDLCGVSEPLAAAVALRLAEQKEAFAGIRSVIIEF